MRLERRTGSDGFFKRMRRLHGDAVAGEDLADNARQVAVVLDDEDARFLARSAKYARQLSQQLIFLERIGNPSRGAGRQLGRRVRIFHA